MMNKLNFENFEDYLLSINISQICREYGFKKLGMQSLYHLTSVLKQFILIISKISKDYCELSNRSEVNLIDILNSFLDKGISKSSLLDYMKQSKLKYPFAKKTYIKKILSQEEQERNSFLQKINSNNIISSENINKDILKMIPQSVKYFPREYSLKETKIKLNVSQEEVKNSQSLIKTYERKNIEDVVSSYNYFDNLSKKHKRKNSLDVNSLFQEIHTNQNLCLGFVLSQEINKEWKEKKKIYSEGEDIYNNQFADVLNHRNNENDYSVEDDNPDILESSQLLE